MHEPEAQPEPETDELDEEQLEQASGGLRAPSPPAGPVPIPYPNTETVKTS